MQRCFLRRSPFWIFHILTALHKVVQWLDEVNTRCFLIHTKRWDGDVCETVVTPFRGRDDSWREASVYRMSRPLHTGLDILQTFPVLPTWMTLSKVAGKDVIQTAGEFLSSCWGRRGMSASGIAIWNDVIQDYTVTGYLMGFHNAK